MEFKNWKDLIKYIIDNGVTNDIANTHWTLDGEGGLNHIDIVQKDGVWGFWATTSTIGVTPVINGVNGIAPINIISTWVTVNVAESYLANLN